MKTRKRRVGTLTGISVAVSLIAVAVAAVGVAAWRLDRHSHATPPPIPLATVPDSFQITYRVEGSSGSHRVVTTERRSVRLPFDGRAESLAGAPPGGQLLSLSISGFGRLLTKTGADAPAAILSLPPAPPPGELRADSALPAALHQGLAQRRERRLVLGRPCQVYRTAGPPETAPLQRIAGSGEKDFTDICLDTQGLVLAETGVSKGHTVYRKVAVRVEINPPLPDELFDTTGPIVPVRQGGGSVRPVSPTSRPPGQFWELGHPVQGFDLQGRYAVIPPQPQNFSDPTRFANRQAGVVDVYRRGHDVLLVERGGTLGGVAPFVVQPDAANADLGALGQGQLLLGLAIREARVSLPGGHYVRVAGTVAPDFLIQVARDLRPVAGNNLVYLDGPQPG